MGMTTNGRFKIGESMGTNRRDQFSKRSAAGKLITEAGDCPKCHGDKVFRYNSTDSTWLSMGLPYKCTKCGARFAK